MPSFGPPNEQDAAFPHQARIFSTTFDIMGRAAGGGTGVISGCEVTEAGTPGFSVVVSSGRISIDFAAEDITGEALSGELNSDGSLPTFNLIYATSGDIASLCREYQRYLPFRLLFPPTLFALAYVYVPAADSTITDSQITDMRVYVPEPQTATTWTRVVNEEGSNKNNSIALSTTALEFAMAANGFYQVRALLMLNSLSSSDYRVGWTGPASPTSVLGHMSRYPFASSSAGPPTDQLISGYETTGISDNLSASKVWINFDFAILNGSNAGTFAITFAQRVAVAENLEVLKGSWLEYFQIV